MPNQIIRIHSDIDTIDVLVLGKKSAHIQAQTILQVGFWVGDKLFPPSRIAYLEILIK